MKVHSITFNTLQIWDIRHGYVELDSESYHIIYLSMKIKMKVPIMGVEFGTNK